MENRLSICEGVLETDFDETLGRLIGERTKAMQTMSRVQAQDNDNLRQGMYYLAGAIGLIIVVLLIEVSSSSRPRYVLPNR